VLTASSILAAVRADVGEEIGVAGARRLAAIDAAELVVADVSDADATVGAEVSYALFRRRCLTLCLCRRGSPGSTFMQGLAGHPLLTTFEYEDATQAEAEAVAFATPPESPGRIFVIEGGDGAGKQTQSRMLLERLRAEGYPCSTLDYPHDAALHGKLIRTLLSGGSVKEYRIGQRSIKRYDLAELLQLEAKLKADVKREEAAQLMANGLGNPRNMFVRFN
jgi:hypothetical protein